MSVKDMTEAEFQEANVRMLARRRLEATQAPQPLSAIIPGVVGNLIEAVQNVRWIHEAVK